MSQVEEELRQGVARLREVLLPFAKLTLTRSGRTATDDETVAVRMGDCRAAQKAMGA